MGVAPAGAGTERIFAMQGKRLERVNQLIKEEISLLIQRELKDPRLGFVTVTEVETTADLKQAKVFVSVLGDDAQWVKSFKALDSARGFVWTWLRRHLDLRVTPELSFRPDRSMEHAARMQTLLAGLKSERGRREEREPDDD
jgi:ribosome-binding factor A